MNRDKVIGHILRPAVSHAVAQENAITRRGYHGLDASSWNTHLDLDKAVGADIMFSRLCIACTRARCTPWCYSMNLSMISCEHHRHRYFRTSRQNDGIH